MLYDKYYKKMLKMSNILTVIHRFRILIISVFLVLISATATFMGVYGMVYDSGDCPSEITYGEQLGYESKSLFTTTVYEYASADGDDWTSDFPKRAGDYKVRSVSTNIFGKARYGGEFSFTILPKEIEVYVNVLTVEYGSLPAVAAELSYSDEVLCSSVIYDDASLTTTGATPDESAVTIVDENGDDVTSNYVINCVKRNITFTQRNIELTLTDAEKVYDGTPLKSADYTITAGSLADGDIIKAEAQADVTDAGTAKNSVGFTITNGDGAEVTANYNINVIGGTLTVTAREVYVSTGGGDFEYDGQEHYSEEYEVAASSDFTGLLSGHAVGKVSYRTGVTDAGEYRNKLEFIITDENGADVTSNYSFVYDYGTLTVTKRKITVKTNSKTWQYCASAFYDESYYITEGSLADGQTAEVKSCAAITDAGEVQNVVVLGIFAGEFNVTDNYEITYDYGILTVTRIDITVATDGGGKTYDGEPLTNGGYSTGGEVADGHTLVVEITGSQTEVGSSQNAATAFVIDGGGADVTANYNITITAGTLAVTGRAITVASDSAQKQYDGAALTAEGFAITSGDLVSWHEGQADGYAQITAVGSADNTFNFYVYDGETDVSANYIMTYDYGTLTITARDITVTAGSDEKEYDGLPLTCAEYTYTGLLEGHTITAQTDGSITEIGVEDNIVVKSAVQITDGDGNSVAGNYNIITVSGALTVTRRNITVTAGSYSKTYDGTALVYDYYEITAGSLLDGHNIAVTVSGSQTDAGASDNDIIYVNITYGGADVNGLYTVTAVNGSLEVLPREITIKTSGAEKVYDDTALTANGENDWSLTDGTLADGQNISVTITGTQTNAGSCENAADVIITDASGFDVTYNYDITTDYGKLVVTPRPVTVNTGSGEWVYDGEEHYNDYYELVENAELTANNVYGILSWHKEYINSYAKIKNAGAVDNLIEFIITDASGGDVTKNYKITYNYGSLVVNPRPITVSTGSGEWVYDGIVHYNAYFAVSTEVQYQLVSGHTAVAAAYTTVINVGDYENEITLLITDASGENVTQNYDITFINGTLTVTKRPITFTTGSGEWVYDGEEHYVEDYYVLSGSFAYYQGAVVGTYTVIKNAGSVENVLNLIIKDYAGNDVTENYEVTYVYGTLTVTKRSVTFTTGSDEWVYDGQAHYCDECQIASGSLYDVVDGQTTYAISHATITDVGTCDNILVIGLKDADGSDVTENYDIYYDGYGTLTVTARYITVSSYSKEWLYEGLEHSYESGDVTDGTLADGQNISFNFTADGITEVGVMTNSYDGVIITDAAGSDVTGNYNISCKYGELEVFSPLVLKAGESYYFTAEADGRFTFTLQSGNATFSINGGDPYAVSQDGASYVVLLEDGDVVTIYASAFSLITAEYTRVGSSLDTSGNIGTNTDGDENGSLVMELYSDESGTLYFKLISYGDYDGSGWSQAQAYGGYITIDGVKYSLSYLAGLALENGGYTSTEVQVINYSADYLLPYQLSTEEGGYTLQTSDVYYIGSESEYALYVYYYDYLTDGSSGLSLPSEYAALEEAYREYVYENYLNVPASTKAYLQTIIDEQNFDTSDIYTLISQVTEYIQNAATYNLKYDTALDDESDIVVAFLKTYKEGICQHYASAATLLFRTLGVPARYTLGYYATTSAGEWTDVTTAAAHAWVEVYISGLGWVTVDVTGAMSGGDGGSDDSDDGSGVGSWDKGELYIKPVDIVKQSDGTALTATDVTGADDESTYILNYLLHLGYTYEVEFGGSQTEVGSSQSTITSFVLYKPNGSVDGYFTVYLQTGTLTVAEEVVITVYLYDLSKEYDGTTLAYGETDYYYISSASGYTAKLSGLSSLSLTYCGVISEDLLQSLTITVYKDGAEVTDGSVYAYIYAANLLTVYQRSITVTSASATKEYDSTELTADSAWISFGSLAAGDTITVVVSGSILTGTGDNTIYSVTITNVAGEDVTDNYVITKVEGTLEVTYNAASQ